MSRHVAMLRQVRNVVEADGFDTGDFEVGEFLSGRLNEGSFG
jgi:hypothetical protein